MQLRLARNKDGNQIINLIKRCFKDYKNCYLDVDNDSPELRNVYSYFKNKKGSADWWVNRISKSVEKDTGVRLNFWKNHLKVYFRKKVSD